MDVKYLKNLNILYVEDDENVFEPTINLLKGFFLNVYHTSSAEDALDVIKNDVVHILITDIELPGMNGLELCETIRKSDKEMPIFIVSMHNNKEMLRKAIKLNLVDYLVKPVTIKQITDSLSESLEHLHKSALLKLQVNDITSYYPLRGEIEKDSQTIRLTQNEVKLLNFLVKNRNQVVSKSAIEHILYPDQIMSESAYKNIIYRLRKKIGKESIISISGNGIKLVSS